MAHPPGFIAMVVGLMIAGAGILAVSIGSFGLWLKRRKRQDHNLLVKSATSSAKGHTVGLEVNMCPDPGLYELAEPEAQELDGNSLKELPDNQIHRSQNNSFRSWARRTRPTISSTSPNLSRTMRHGNSRKFSIARKPVRAENGPSSSWIINKPVDTTSIGSSQSLIVGKASFTTTPDAVHVRAPKLEFERLNSQEAKIKARRAQLEAWYGKIELSNIP